MTIIQDPLGDVIPTDLADEVLSNQNDEELLKHFPNCLYKNSEGQIVIDHRDGNYYVETSPNRQANEISYTLTINIISYNEMREEVRITYKD